MLSAVSFRNKDREQIFGNKIDGGSDGSDVCSVYVFAPWSSPSRPSWWVPLWQMRQMPLTSSEFSPLTLQVRTEALGLSAAEVESLITVPLEADLLIGVPWLKSIDSESITGVSSIDLLFEPGTDLMRARQMVNERMTQARALPNVSTPPTLLQPVATANRHERRTEFQVRSSD